MILPNATVATRPDIEITAPPASRKVLVSEPVHFSPAKDMAYVTLVAQESVHGSQQLACHYTFIAQKQVDGVWVLVHGQKSTPVEA